MFARKENNKIKTLEDDLLKEKKQNNELINDIYILLCNLQEMRKQEEDLLNNIEFLFNNLSEENKKLVRPED